MAMSTMIATATMAMMVQAVGDKPDEEVFVVVVVVDELVVALVSGACWVCVVVEFDEPVVAETAGSARATINADMVISLSECGVARVLERLLPDGRVYKHCMNS